MKFLRKKVLAVQHVPFEDLGTFEPALQQAGFEIEYFNIASQRSLADLQQTSVDLAVFLGGPISVNDEKIFPFLEGEIQFVRERIERDLPTLGICLGAQLIARASGARVYPSIKEIGWKALKLTEDGANSSLRHFSEKLTSMFHWHGETFELPPRAKLLASTDAIQNQAFSIGKNVLGMQFHPEADAMAFEQWYIAHICELMMGRIDISKLRADAAIHSTVLKQQSAKFLEEWLSTCFS